MSASRLRAAALAACLLLAARAASAGTEEFSTLDVFRPEEDDESTIDHLLTAPPRSWDAEWTRAAMGLRTSQGCLTSGQWLMDTRLRVETPLGDRARFGVSLEQYEADLASYQYLDLTARFPTRLGTFGGLFRPFHDKSRQDFAVLYDAGADTTRLQVQAVFGLEDMFNNLWAWRQTRVGDEAEPYERHPWEPALRVARREQRWRFDVGGKYLTPSRKRVPEPEGLDGILMQTLWGVRAGGRIGVDALGAGWEASTVNWQASSTSDAEPDPEFTGSYTPADLARFAAGDAKLFRRLWSTRLAARRALGAKWTGEIAWTYQGRTQSWGPPTGPGRFDAIDRVVSVEATRKLSPHWEGRIGGLFDSVSLANTGTASPGPHGSRDEKRAYIGLAATFGRVRLYGVEGLELDHETYPVWFIHDKGFLGLQALF
jgi:hypothetical protein